MVVFIPSQYFVVIKDPYHMLTNKMFIVVLYSSAAATLFVQQEKPCCFNHCYPLAYSSS